MCSQDNILISHSPSFQFLLGSWLNSRSLPGSGSQQSLWEMGDNGCGDFFTAEGQTERWKGMIVPSLFPHAEVPCRYNLNHPYLEAYGCLPSLTAGWRKFTLGRMLALGKWSNHLSLQNILTVPPVQVFIFCEMMGKSGTTQSKSSPKLSKLSLLGTFFSVITSTLF